MTGSKPKVLLVDDDIDLCEMLADYLSQNDYQVDMVHNSQDAMSFLTETTVDMIILDIMMPGQTGLELLPQLRSNWSTPVIMVTGRGDDIDRIVGLEMGADDYISKPCNPRELTARIQAVLRRTQSTPAPASNDENIVSSQGITLNQGKRSATLNDQSINLTTVEFDMLNLLIRNAGKAVSKEELSETVLQRKLSPYDRSVDVHVSRLRNKIKENNGKDGLIKTIRGQGYQFIRD